jgi:inorganic pyrophosphatase
MKKINANNPVRNGRTLVDIIIETPRDSRNKIKFDAPSRRFKLSKILPEGMVFPYDFGFVPNTQAGDGDALDVLVLADEGLFPGCLVQCTLIGVLEAKQREKGCTVRNDRLIAVAEQALLYSNVRTLADLNPRLLSQIEAFFVNYQRVRGIKFEIIRRGGPKEAVEALHNAGQSYKAA